MSDISQYKKKKNGLSTAYHQRIYSGITNY